MSPVNAIQLKILMALANYRFLTNSQLLRLELGTNSKSTVWKHTNILKSKSRGYIDQISYGTIIRLGRVENVLYLTQKGKRLLIEESGINKGQIHCPIGSPQLTDDYMHRIETINFHISLNRACKVNNKALDFFLPYFVKKKIGRTFQSVTAVDLSEEERIVPDSIFKVSDVGRSRHFLFELHNGRSIRRLKDQIFNHARALTERRTHVKFGIPDQQYYQVLIVLENEAAYKSLIKEMMDKKTQYQNIHQFFLCKTLAQLNELTFWDNWKSILGDEAEIQI